MRYPSIAFLLTALLTLTAAVAAQPRKNLKALQDEAAKAFDQKKYDVARDKYGEILAINPNNSPAHFRKGFAHFNLKEYDAALTEFTAALNQGFNRPLEIYKVRAYIYNEQQKYDEALADIQKGLALAPADGQLLRGRMEVFIGKKDWPGAVKAGEEITKIAPNDAQVQYNLARAYYGMGDLKGQRTAAQNALTRGTLFPGESYFLVADACQRLRDLPCAIDAYQKGIGVKPDLIDFYRNLAQIYKEENRITDAMNLLKRAQQKYPTNGLIFLDLSRLYSLIDRPDDAVKAGLAALQLLPNDPATFTNICRAYNDTKAYDQAIGACNGALKMMPGDGETYFYLGRAYSFQNKTPEANRAYAQAVTGLAQITQREPSAPDGWYLLGNAYFANNERDKAVEAYSKALALAPKFARAHYNLGIIYTRMKNKARATEQYTALQALDAKLATSLKGEIDRM